GVDGCQPARHQRPRCDPAYFAGLEWRGRRPAAVDLRGGGVRVEGSRVRRLRLHREVAIRSGPAKRGLGLGDRNGADNLGAGPRRALDLKVTAEHSDAIAHVLHPRARARPGWIDAMPVVTD